MTIIERAENYIRELFKNDCSGHDYFHSLRVCRTALQLAQEEGADTVETALIALLHDADDVKLSPETHAHKDRAAAFLIKEGLSEEKISRILAAIDQISFRGTDSVVPSTLEGRCVQDADRLDALGAIGIARTFAYGGNHGRAMYDPGEKPCLGMNGESYRARVSTSVNHFYEKLFLLKDMMNTDSAKRLANTREAFMREYLTHFFAEWNGEA